MRMENERRFIGFDLGAESGRCVVASVPDAGVTLTEVHRFPTHQIRHGTALHWDLGAISREIVEGLARAGKAFGPRFEGIGIDTWGVDYVLLDAEGRALGDPYHYRDDRTDHIMEEAFRIVPREVLYGKAGIQFMQFNTLFQLLAEAKGDLLGRADTMLLMPDYLNFLLSGVRRAEYSIASTTSLIDPVRRQWSWELIDAFGLPRKIFPEIIEPGTVLGTLLPAIAARTGLDAGIRVIAAAGHDTASAVASVPVQGRSWGFLSSGTWSLMGIELARPLLSAAALKYNFTNEGGVEGTTRFLKNIMGLWPVQECRRTWREQAQERSYAELMGLARDAGFVRGWIDVDDPRFLKPGAMPEKVCAYLRESGQEARSDAGFIVRVLLESLAFRYRKTIREIEEVAGCPIESLHAVGGGIQNELLVQLTADAIGREVVAGPVEGTIVGNIGVQAIARGLVKDLGAWRGVVARSFSQRVFAPTDAGYFNDHEEKFAVATQKHANHQHDKRGNA